MQTITIHELPWQPHRSGLGGEQAIVTFPNGYGASVLRGGQYYTSGGTYEIAVLHHGDITYDTPITSDVLGHLSESEANETLEQIAALPENPAQTNGLPGGPTS